MKMYIWSQRFLEDWTSGLGVAVAENVDEARALLIAEALRQDKGYCASAIAGDTVREPDSVLDLPAAAFVYGGS